MNYLYVNVHVYPIHIILHVVCCDACGSLQIAILLHAEGVRLQHRAASAINCNHPYLPQHANLILKDQDAKDSCH